MGVHKHTQTRAHTHTHTQTAGCLKPSQDLALISPLSLFHSVFAHSLPFSGQIAAAFDVLRRLLLEHQRYSVILTHPWLQLNVHSWLLWLSLFNSVSFLSFQRVHLSHSRCISIRLSSETLIRISSQLNSWPLTFQERALFTFGGNPLLLLSMLKEFLCSLIKRIEFASTAGCYMASWIRTHTRKCAHLLANTHSRTAMHTPIHPSWQLVNCQGVNGKWLCNCIRVLIYPGLLFIYLAVDFKAALIV